MSDILLRERSHSTPREV